LREWPGGVRRYIIADGFPIFGEESIATRLQQPRHVTQRNFYLREVRLEHGCELTQSVEKQLLVLGELGSRRLIAMTIEAVANRFVR